MCGWYMSEYSCDQGWGLVILDYLDRYLYTFVFACVYMHHMWQMFSENAMHACLYVYICMCVCLNFMWVLLVSIEMCFIQLELFMRKIKILFIKYTIHRSMFRGFLNINTHMCTWYAGLCWWYAGLNCWRLYTHRHKHKDKKKYMYTYTHVHRPFYIHTWYAGLCCLGFFTHIVMWLTLRNPSYSLRRLKV